MDSSSVFQFVPPTLDEQYASYVNKLTGSLRHPARYFASLRPVIELCVQYYPRSEINPILREYEEMLYELETLEKDINAYARERPSDIQKVYKSLVKRLNSFWDREGPFVNKITALADRIPPREQQEDILHNLSLLNQFMETNGATLPQWLKDKWAPLKQDYEAFRIYPNTMERVNDIWNEVNALPSYSNVSPVPPLYKSTSLRSSAHSLRSVSNRMSQLRMS